MKPSNRVHVRRGRRVPVSRPLAVTGAVIVWLAALAAAAPASPAAAAGASYSLISGYASFKADGHTWHLGVLAASGTTMTVLISTPHLGGSEVHHWDFKPLPAADFKVDPTTGHATLDSHSALAPVASLALSFTPTSHVKATCATGSGTDFTGELSGSVSLVTGLQGLKFRTTHASFSTPNTLEVSHACTAPVPCVSQQWVFGLSPEVIGATTGTASESVVTQTATIKKPAGATLTVTAGMSTPVPVFDKSAKSLTVQGSKSGLITGTAVISHPSVAEPFAGSCTMDGKNYSEHGTEYAGATYSSPAGKQFQARTILSGTLTLKPTGAGLFDIVTLTES
jgi:hypothetical protein